MISKLRDIKHRYGIKAAEHFQAFPICSRCQEERLAALNVHHTRGKEHEEFETLCFNCHMIEHHGSATYKSETILETLRAEVRRKKTLSRNTYIQELRREGKSTRQIAKLVKVSNATVWTVLRGSSTGRAFAC